jgi:putative transposase
MSHLPGKTNFKRMRYPVHVILSVLSMFYLGKDSFRNIALIMRIVFNIKVSHTSISNWCKNFAPLFQNMSLQLIPSLHLNSDEWHADETVVKVAGVKHYIWFVIDLETRFVVAFHLSPHRDSAYNVPVKSVFKDVKYIQVESFKDYISNNLIESFNHQFKAWCKTKQGFYSFDSANNLISMFVFFYNFVRPHAALNYLTPAQVAGLNLTKKQKREYLIVV